jgi:hypothetical protein
LTAIRPLLLSLLALSGASPAATAQRFDPPAIQLPPLVPPPAITRGVATGPQAVTLTASIAGETRPIRSGLVWRVYRDNGTGQAPTLAAKIAAPTPTTTLEPGNYVVHATYGLASKAQRFTVTTGATKVDVDIDAGALKLGGMIAGVPIPPERIDFTIYQPLPSNPEGRVLATGVRGGDIVRLPEGSYHVVSTYGESNAIMRIDLKVDRGRITEATLNHRAATVTLKLVDNPKGEAYAGTAFSVLTPGGDVVREAIGAFPTVALAEGEYTLIARHNGKVYTREFRVETGLDVDVEVLATST